jgi:transcriptional regulator
MYIPKAFEVTDPNTIRAFVEAHSFATLVTSLEAEMFATRLPLILDFDASGKGTLTGHVARANPHWRSFDGECPALAMFDGPHAYVSPNWYATSPAVPTWNYATVHIYGAPHIIDDAGRVEAIVDRLSTIHEAGMPTTWHETLPADFKAKLLKGIVGFEMAIDRFEAKFKLGQNRPLEDQIGAVEHLEKSSDCAERELARLTRNHLRLNP